LTGTAEVPLGAMYMDQILSEEQLAIKMAGFGHCFRTEAGAGGDITSSIGCVSSNSVTVVEVCSSQQDALEIELAGFRLAWACTVLLHELQCFCVVV